MKEEQKQHLTDMMKEDEELGLYGEVHGKQGTALTSDYLQSIGKEITPEQIWNEKKLEGIKQLIQDYGQESVAKYVDRHLIQALVEASKQKLYTEEEVLELLHTREQYLIENTDGFYESDIEWFTKFKKK